MKFLVRVKINFNNFNELSEKLQNGKLDKGSICGETYCIREDLSVWYSIWEALNKEEFEKKFKPWKKYYSYIEVTEVISLDEAIKMLL